MPNNRHRGSWWRAKMRDLLIAEGHTHCGICQGSFNGETPHIDHKVPLSKGGTDDLSNLHLTHPVCNNRKGNDHGVYLDESRRRL